MECLNSLKSSVYPYFEVYLVDNFSEKRSVEHIVDYLNNDDFYSYDIVKKNNLNNFVKDDSINLVFILNDENSGFAGGNNLALNYIIKNYSDGYVMLLNNDTIITDDLLNSLIQKFNEADDVGFVGANHFYYHNPKKLQTVGGGLIDLVHGECSAITDFNSRDDFDFLTGSCIFMSVPVLKDVGVMNEDYFMYWEDVDWSTVARKKNYKLKISDKGCIYHKEGASIQSLHRIYYHTRNRILYMKRNTTGLIYYKFIIYIFLYVMKESFTNIHKNKQYSITLLKGLKDGLKKIL